MKIEDLPDRYIFAIEYILGGFEKRMVVLISDIDFRYSECNANMVHAYAIQNGKPFTDLSDNRLIIDNITLTIEDFRKYYDEDAKSLKPEFLDEKAANKAKALNSRAEELSLQLQEIDKEMERIKKCR